MSTIIGEAITTPLRRGARSVADQVALHGELFQLEWRAEKVRLLKLTLAWLISVMLLSMVLIFASVALLAAVWDGPYRMHAALGLVALYAGALLAVHFWRQQLSREGEASFAATREQIAEEGAFIRTLLE